MNVQVFIFKLVAVIWYMLRFLLLTLPITVIIVFLKKGAWKYGFTFIQSSFEVSLFIAFALSFLVVMYHALSFELLGQVPNENYLKVKQKVKVKGNISLKELADRIQEEFKIRDFHVSESELSFRKLVHFSLPDKVNIRKEGDEFILESSPFTNLWFMDFGRNYSTVKKIAIWIKQKA
ncbi:hypothetical protein GYB22_12450 [bacterium]|nr:hypothetical protein [bacterium]